MLDILKPLIFLSIASFSHRWMWINSCGKSTRILFWIVLFRFALSSFHEMTYPQILGPFSIVSLYSIFVVVALVVFISSNNVVINRNYSFYMILSLLVSMAFAAIVNSHYIQSVASVVKWLMLLLLINVVHDSLYRDGPSKTLRALGFAYLYPCILMVASVVLGVSKATENDGSVSYIGGFHHEAVFSIVILTGMFVYLMIGVFEKRRRLVGLSLFILIVMLFLINYRTTVLAAFGMFSIVGFLFYQRQVIRIKMSISLVLLFGVIVVNNTDSTEVFERFQEIPQAVNGSAGLTAYPELYDSEERKFFSGRIYYWSSYIHEALSGSTLQIFFGHGMDAWKGAFEKYAHNTFVSFFYEVGVVGLTLLVLFFICVFVRAMYGRDWLITTFLVGFVFAFLILNIATMPLWQIEGVMFLSILLSLIELNKKQSTKQCEVFI